MNEPPRRILALGSGPLYNDRDDLLDNDRDAVNYNITIVLQKRNPMSRYAPGHKEEARTRMIAAVGRGFRQRGFGGIGVDGLAKAADVTSGAFYGHFKSKDDAFNEVVAVGIAQLKTTIQALQQAHGRDWVGLYVDRYLGEKRLCDLGESCALQSLSSEVGRSEARIKHTYCREIIEVAQAVADGFEGGAASERLDRAWAFLAILSGSVTMARAVDDKAISDAIARGARDAALRASQP
jgi:TetR/AcrR family transcriptional regulator, transcriptional repressor for nem operon